MIPLRDQQVLRERFQRELTSRIRLDFFGQKPASAIFVPGRQECPYCDDVKTLVEEVASFSDRVSLTLHDIEAQPDVAKAMGVDKVPAIVLRGQTNRPIRYFGVPAGTEFPVFIETLLEAARGEVPLQPETVKALRKLKQDVRLQVMVIPTCAFSPGVVRIATRLALQSVRIKVDVVEISEFPALAQRYNIRACPTMIIDEKYAMAGSMDEPTLVQDLLRIVEGKAIAAGRPAGQATAFTPQNEQQQRQQAQPKVTASGLILPGR